MPSKLTADDTPSKKIGAVPASLFGEGMDTNELTQIYKLTSDKALENTALMWYLFLLFYLYLVPCRYLAFTNHPNIKPSNPLSVFSIVFESFCKHFHIFPRNAGSDRTATAENQSSLRAFFNQEFHLLLYILRFSEGKGRSN